MKPADVIASMNNAAGGNNSTKAPVTLANVKDNLKDAANGKAAGTPAGGSRADLTKGKGGSNAATVNDVLNAGFTVQGNGFTDFSDCRVTFYPATFNVFNAMLTQAFRHIFK